VRKPGKVLVIAMAVAGAMGVVAPGASAQGASGVYGWVWFDRDENRSLDFTDAPRTGFTVTVHEVATGVDRAAVTNVEGYFSLDDLPLGMYDVTAADDGYRSVSSSIMRVDVIDSRPRSTYFPQVGGRIWGRAWLDANADGVRQAGEPGAGVAFTLFGPSDVEGDTRAFSSDPDGDYELLDVPSGTYRIEAVSPSGTVGTRYRTPGSEWYTDSDFAGTVTSVSDPFELWAAGPVANIDAGFVAV
jgi:hypothetical protein